ncbi:hypothetical protein AAC387_Pa05g1012 [Persea americana]
MYCQLPSCSSHCANIGRPALWHASHQVALPLPRLKMVAGPQLEPNSQLLQRPASCNVAASCYAQQPVPHVAAGGATTATKGEGKSKKACDAMLNTLQKVGEEGLFSLGKCVDGKKKVASSKPKAKKGKKENKLERINQEQEVQIRKTQRTLQVADVCLQIW